MAGWYNKVADNSSNIKMHEYFDAELEDAKKECIMQR